MSSERSKLGPAARQLVDASSAASAQRGVAGDAHANADAATVSVLISVTRGMTDEDRRGLEAMGVAIRSHAGDVYTASMPAAQLMPLARLPLVRYVDLATPLHPEPRRPG